MNEPRVVESVTNECQSLGRAHESSSARAEQLIACLEGEIAKRDARIVELAAAHDHYIEQVESSDAELTEAKKLIAELEADRESWADRWIKAVNHGGRLEEELAALKAQEPVAWLDTDGELYAANVLSGLGIKTHKLTPLYAAPVSEAKAQGVVMPEGWIPLTIEHEPGYPEDVAFGPKRMMDRLKKWLDRYFEMRLNAAPVLQVIVPDGWRELAKRADDFLYSLPETDGVLRLRADLCSMLAAAPAAPAADARLLDWTKDAVEWGGALNYAAWEFVNECPEKSALLFNNTKGPLRAAIMKYAEIVAANAKDSSHDQ